MKVEDFRPGMKNINIKLKIDYVPEKFMGKDWRIVFVKDDSKDIKMILTGDNAKKAEEGKTIEIKNGFIEERRGQLQLITDDPVEYV